MKSSTVGNDKSNEDEIVFRKLQTKIGPEETTLWFEELAKLFRRLPESLNKKQLCSILDKDKNYTPIFQDLATIMKERGINNEEHGKALEKAMAKQTSLETIDMPSARSRSHAIITHLLDTCAKGVASADPEFRKNDDLTNPDPVVTMRALKRILITEREGTGSAQKVAAKTAAINDLLTMRKNDNSSGNESLIDFREKLDRKVKVMKSSFGVDTIPDIFTTEPELVTFFVFRLDSKYAQLQRDIENKIIDAPLTLDAAVTMAKDRVEVTKKTHETVAPVSVFTTAAREHPTITRATKNPTSSAKSARPSYKKSPQPQEQLKPYPVMSTTEYSALPDHGKLEIKRHHSAIKTAASTVKKTIANNRAGRSTLATIHAPESEEVEVSFVMMSHETIESDDDGLRGSCPSLVSSSGSEDDIGSDDDELEEFEESYVLMSYELPQETTEAPSDPEGNPGETAPPQLEAEHGDIIEPNQTPDAAMDVSIPDTMSVIYPNVAHRLDPQGDVYRLINVCHSIFDSQNGYPSHWYCIGGPNHDTIYVNHADAIRDTWEYPPGHIQGFQSLEALRIYQSEVLANLTLIGRDRASYAVQAWAEGNAIMVRFHGTRTCHCGLSWCSVGSRLLNEHIYNTVPTDHAVDTTPTDPRETSYPYGRTTYDIGSDNLPLPDPGPNAVSAHHRHPFNPNWPTSNVEAPVVGSSDDHESFSLL